MTRITQEYHVPVRDWQTFVPVEKFGRVAGVGDGDENIDVTDCGGQYGFLAAATALKVSSSSANDAVAGTGAACLGVHWLDGSWAEQITDVDLNGQTGVDLGEAIRVYRARVKTPGSALAVNDGDIWVGDGAISSGVPANKRAGVLAGRGQTLMAVYTIPVSAIRPWDNKRCNVSFAKITRWHATCGANKAAYCAVALEVREFGGCWQTKDFRDIEEGNGVDHTFSFGKDIAPKTDIRLRVVTNGVVNTAISGGFDIEMAI